MPVFDPNVFGVDWEVRFTGDLIGVPYVSGTTTFDTLNTPGYENLITYYIAYDGGPLLLAPPSDYVVFDPNVFDWSFAIMDIIPTFDKVIVDREFKKVEAGQAVAILCSIQDIITTPGQRFQFDPTSTPQIQIFNPDNTAKIGVSNMAFVSTGVYIYQHQTSITDQAGIYTARFSAIDGTMTGVTDKVVAFEITSDLQVIPSTGTGFYFAMGPGTDVGTFALYLFTTGTPGGIIIVDNIIV